MAPSLQSLGLDQMSVEERLTLAQQLWDSVAEELERQPLSLAQRAELERRVAAADANPADGVPWEVIRAEARALATMSRPSSSAGADQTEPRTQRRRSGVSG